MKKNWVLLVLMVSIGLNLGLGVRLIRPQTEPEHMRRMMQDRMARLSRQLDLTPQQVDAFKSIHAKTSAAFFADRREVEHGRRELRDLAIDGRHDRAEILGRRQRLSALQARLDSLVVETMLQEIAILDPAQRERYRDLMPLGPGPRER